MKLIDYETQKAIEIENSNNSGNYYKLFTVPFKDKDYECYTDLNEVVIRDSNGSITKLQSYNDDDVRQFLFKAFKEKSDNLSNLKNLKIYNKKLLNQEKKFELISMTEYLTTFIFAAIPIVVGFEIGKDNGWGMGIASGITTIAGEMVIFFALDQENYDSLYEKSKKLYYDRKRNICLLDQAITREIMLEPVMYKDQADLKEMAKLNEQRKTILGKTDDFSDMADRFIRTKKK